MSRRVTLYIGDQKADLAESSPILFNWTREELDNPTIVRNSYTRQVTLPATPANDAIFGAFHRVDRAYTPVLGQTTGVAFNPLKKASFALYDERSEVLARGYLKLDAIALRGEQAAGYTCSLYGGLGSLFYDLDTTADGDKRTLADLIYGDGNGGDLEPETETMSVDRLTVAAIWGASVLTPVPDWARVVTFVPCYNGLPAGEFDAGKAVVSAASWYNFPVPVTDGGISYNYLTGESYTIATFQNKHTEWEMRDLRAWLQRPAVSVKAVLEALTDPRNTGDWELTLYGAFFSSGSNPWYDDAWMTLPLLSRPEDGDWTGLALADALRGTMSPAAFLIGYAKQFGLVFDVDEATRTVTLMSRDDYYDGGTVHDLTEHIDRTTIDLKPVNASARWYEMKAQQVDAAFTKEYADAYGRVYGSQRIDTGWEFDASVKDLLPDFPFKGAADVLETSPLFYGNYYNGQSGLAACDQETVKYKLYDASGNAKDFDAYIGQYLAKTVTWYNSLHNGADAFPKVQLHAADGKGSDGSGVLVIRTGEATLPSVGWHVSDDTQEMWDLNEGRPCWILAGNFTSLSKLPVFRRMAGALTMDFGAPRELAVPDESTDEGATIYYNRWRGYLADRLDVDTKVMTCKVLLDGLRPGAGLLRDMYWYRSALWSLNRIKDYAPALDGLTECEFVQVRDADAYTASQAVPAMESWYLNASPASLSFIPAGEGLTVTITANVSWTLTVPAWLTASQASGSGNAVVTLTAGANAGAARTGTVTLTGAHSTSAAISVSQATSFTPSIAVSPTTKSIDDKARTFYYHITCNGDWEVKSITASWLTCTSTGSGNGTAVIGIAKNTTSSSRTGIITFKMTDYPATTCSTTITQAAQASTMTYALELGSSSRTFAVSGGTYTLTAQGVTYTNGVETSRANLTASDLSFSKTGSDAITRSGLTFSAADLGATETAEQTAIYTITWSANGSQATFTAKQSANVITYLLSLGAASHAFPASGDSYTLTVNGIVKRNGSTYSTTALAASALSISRSGSTAVTNSGLTFTAADLLGNETAGTTTTFSLVWSAHTGATATFTATQEANTYSVVWDYTTWQTPNMPATIIWTQSGEEVAAGTGDTAPIDSEVTERHDERRSWTSGHIYDYVYNVHHAASFTVSGTGLAVQNSGTLLRWYSNSSRFARFGSLTLTTVDEEWSNTWTLQQAGTN